MNKVPTVSDRELVKWTKILGADQMIYLYIKNKIRLTSQQLDKVIAIKDGIDGEPTKN